MNELKIEINHLKKAYLRPVLTDINLAVDNSSYITIIGKSGSGKSTLLNILGLLESYDSGEYRFNGTLIRNYTDYAKLRLNNIGFIFQSYNLIPTLTCYENILMPTLYSGRGNKGDLDSLVELLDIAPLLSQRVTTLSGGEKQRVAIARSLILDPCLILADEPTGNLDTKNREIIFNLLDHEHKKGRAVILITHDADIAARAETVMELKDGMLEKKNK
ncbi:MAG: ABC transporter ATP-binding protein [Clostridia bacterium]|nr:ABC transporter ATP-binding protein [Clostridia bacterium]